MPSSTNRHSEKGLVFNIQRFSVHDGPGIRTTVFLKGCPLRCRWCSNPESQSFLPSLLVRDGNCRGCGECTKICPQGALAMDRDLGRVIHWEKCDQCLLCVRACVPRSLNACGQYLTAEEILQEVMKDRLFYKNSGGGVTFSGGEPLGQVEVLLILLQTLKEEGIPAALDTSGYAQKKVFDAVLPLVDLVLFDIKHLDDEKHRRFTGVSNRDILANARLAAGKVRTWFRIPLIANFNDDLDHIGRVAEMAKEIGIEKISLLLYHEGGLSKCRQTGQPYRMGGAKPPSKDRVEALRRIVAQRGLDITINH